MPSTNLVGMKTECNWEVIQRIDTQQTSGGNFCTRYLVVNPQGKIAFLKAMDLSRAFKEEDELKALQTLTSEYLFEQEILFFCKDKKLPNVVTPISAGQIVNNQFPAPLNKVYFIIFEKAECDMREAFLKAKPSIWREFFKAMHHVCLGIEQLHMNGIAHQDVKPSNILHFKEFKSKISDLGRVTDDKGKSPFIKYYYPGDMRYAPIEVHYRVRYPTFQHRYLCDLYAVGSLIYQTIMGPSVTASLASESTLLNQQIFSVSYDESLPVHITAFSTLMSRLHDECRKLFTPQISDAIVIAISEMCHPDFRKRGSPKIISAPYKFNMRRYSGKMANIHRLMLVQG
ncbi:MAG TPA: hypothetical protein DG048_20775 [Pseudoalteromonas sp.]|nr:hypothetical protein [Pseudoalteromonas sp.]|tara:strand:- start:3030 stop:4058 length:1029 start_codon:yes stop_codon:yes gene_type:complete